MEQILDNTKNKTQSISNNCIVIKINAIETDKDSIYFVFIAAMCYIKYIRLMIMVLLRAAVYSGQIRDDRMSHLITN